MMSLQSKLNVLNQLIAADNQEYLKFLATVLERLASLQSQVQQLPRNNPQLAQMNKTLDDLIQTTRDAIREKNELTSSIMREL